MQPPRVSVIVPVRNRRALLKETLRALVAQTFRDYEIIVADDGSSDGSGDLAAFYGCRVVRTEGRGAVAARTAAVAEARGSILAFTDSDCLPAPDWLERGVASIDAGADVVQGITLPVHPPGPLERSIAHGGGERLFATCNVFYRREAFERAGGFDGAAARRWRFRGPAAGRALGFGEDTLLGWTVARSGVASVEPRAVVRHAVVQPPVRELLWRAWMAGGFPALVREVPELRRTLLRRRVFLGTRRVPLYATVLAALALRRPAALAVGAWWVGARTAEALRKKGSLSRRLASVPVEMAVDVVTAVALVGGGLRSRCIVV